MKEIITYRQVSFDTVDIKPGQPIEATFFGHQPLALDGSTPITDFGEKAIVRWLMLCSPARQLLMRELDLPPDALRFPEVVEPFFLPGKGDLDLIFCPKSAPQFSVCLECKRVKVEILHDDQDRLTKLQDLAGGVAQANRLYSGPHAFHQIWFTIITEVDAARQNEPSLPIRGIPSDSRPMRGDTQRTTLRQLVEFPGRDQLNQNVGILFIEITQPSRLSVDRLATVRVCGFHRAERREQRDSVTNMMAELIARDCLQ